MARNLSGKKALVTGAGGGIGQAIVESLKAHGVTVAGTDQSACPNSDVSLVGNLIDAAFCDALPGNAREQLGGLDIVINNAGIIRRGPVTDATDDDYAASFAVNVEAPFRICRAAIPLLAEAGGGAIVHISSISGLTQSQRTPPYGAVKAALNQYTMTQALDLAPRGIRVNAIAPGSIYFEGGVWGKAEVDNPALFQSILASIPGGRYGRPEEVAAVAVFLASDPGCWVTGQTIAVDGGQML